MDLPTDQERLELRALDRLYRSGGVGDESATLEALFPDEDEYSEWLSSAQRRGLIRADGMLVPTYTLTTEGRQIVEETRQRREDRRSLDTRPSTP